MQFFFSKVRTKVPFKMPEHIYALLWELIFAFWIQMDFFQTKKDEEFLHKYLTLLLTYLEVPNKGVTYLIIFWDFFSTFMVLLGPIRLFIFVGKSSHLNCFLRNKYQKILTYTFLFKTYKFIVSEKTSHLHVY